MKTIPFYTLTPQHDQIREELLQAMVEVHDSGQYILGPKLGVFEEQFAKYLGVKYCIGVGNGLDALKISLKALSIGHGDEVITPANTFIATILAISAVGAIPVLVEPNPDSHNIDPNKIEEKITSKTKAIIPVHLYGLPCDMDEIKSMSDKYGLYLVEDNAQATGAEYKGLKTGSFGHLSAHSFYPTKNLGAIGDGGAITTNDKDLAEKVRLLRNYGSAVKYENEILGYNSRLDEIQAAVLSVKLKYLDRWNLDREVLAQEYNKALSTCPFLQCSELNPYKKHVHHLYVVKAKQRDQLVAYLNSQGISSGMHYPIPPYRQAAYRGKFNASEYPVTDTLSKEVLSLPLYPGMSRESLDQVIASVLAFYKH